MGLSAPSLVLGPSKALPFPVCKPQQDMHHSRRPLTGRPERGDSVRDPGKNVCLKQTSTAPAPGGEEQQRGLPQADMGKDKQGPQTPRKGCCGGPTRRLNWACLCSDCASRRSRPSTRCCQGGWDHASSGWGQVCAWTCRRGPQSSQSRPHFTWELHS